MKSRDILSAGFLLRIRCQCRVCFWWAMRPEQIRSWGRGSASRWVMARWRHAEIGDAFQRNDFSFNGYRCRVLRSALGQVLIARWVVAQIVYSFKWKWFQILVWRNSETDCCPAGMDIYLELGEKNAFYSLILFKKPGVFNSRSSR